jgi:hypothetical protein
LHARLTEAKRAFVLANFLDAQEDALHTHRQEEEVIVKCRAYFTEHHKSTDYRSVVFVPAFALKGETTFTEFPEFKVFNVGSACPPDCETGRPKTGNTGDDTGARFAREAYSAKDIPCLQFGAGNTQDCK